MNNVFIVKTSELKNYIANPYGYAHKFSKEFKQDLNGIKTPYAQITADVDFDDYEVSLKIEQAVLPHDFNFTEVINAAAFVTWRKMAISCISARRIEWEKLAHSSITSKEINENLMNAMFEYRLALLKKSLTFIECNYFKEDFFKVAFNHEKFEDFEIYINLFEKLFISNSWKIEKYLNLTPEQIHRRRNEIVKAMFNQNFFALRFKFKEF